jgi:hypothetical protein
MRAAAPGLAFRFQTRRRASAVTGHLPCPPAFFLRFLNPPPSPQPLGDAEIRQSPNSFCIDERRLPDDIKMATKSEDRK